MVVGIIRSISIMCAAAGYISCMPAQIWCPSDAGCTDGAIPSDDSPEIVSLASSV